MRIQLILKLHSPLVGTKQDIVAVVFFNYRNLVHFLYNRVSRTQIEKILAIREL